MTTTFSLLGKLQNLTVMNISMLVLLNAVVAYGAHLVRSAGRLNNITVFRKMWYNSGVILELYHKVIIWMKSIFLLPIFIGNVGNILERNLNNITFHLINITFYMINITNTTE